MFKINLKISIVSTNFFQFFIKFLIFEVKNSVKFPRFPEAIFQSLIIPDFSHYDFLSFRECILQISQAPVVIVIRCLFYG